VPLIFTPSLLDGTDLEGQDLCIQIYAIF